ncbi:MAG TPA: IclR family transcriptional regulator [Acidimicrobiia bacterium]|nr:IclR family transcriptional regulator [Acidimicrobiia bacterium]
MELVLPGRPEKDMRGSERLFAIIEDLSGEPKTLTEVATAVGLPKSTALRFLRTLEAAGWVVRDKSGVYTLGAVVVGLAAQYLSSDPVVTAATPVMRELRAYLNETVSLSRRIGLTRVCVVEFPSTQNLRLVLGIGERGPLHAGASGLLLYAYMSPEERASLGERTLERYTARTITDPVELEHEATVIGRRGWAISKGQRTKGGVAMAAPIFEPGSNREVAALGLLGPELRCSTQREQKRWLDALITSAREINDAMTHSNQIA